MGRRKRRNPDAIPRTSDSAPSDSDLPGYVFDPVTKRHFRVPINSPFSTAYLPDTVKKLYQKPAESSCSDANQVRNSLRKSSLNHDVNMTAFLQHFQYGNSNCNQLERFSWENQLRKLNGIARVKQNVSRLLSLPDSNDSVECQYLHTDHMGKNLIGLWSFVENQRYQSSTRRLDVKFDLKMNSESSWGWKFWEGPSNSDFSDFRRNTIDSCMAKSDRICVATVLRGSASSDVNRNCLRIQFLYHTSAPDEWNTEETLIRGVAFGDSDLWCCALDPVNNRVAVGTAESAFVLHFECLGATYPAYRGNETVLGLKFSKDGNRLYSGRRGADIICIDTSKADKKSGKFILPMKSACQLETLEDSNYLLGKSLTDEICLFDIRQKKVVKRYCEPNPKAYKKLPFLVDAKEKLLISMSESATGWSIQSWSLLTGETLCKFQSQLSSTAVGPNLPRMCYSQYWGGFEGHSALVLAAGREIEIFELK